MAVEERDSKTVEVAIEAAPVEPPPPPPVERAPDPPKRVEKRSKVPAIVALGAGVASGVVGAVFLGLRGGTLSDLDEPSFERILEQRLSPLYVSVHATDPELRWRLLGQP